MKTCMVVLLSVVAIIGTGIYLYSAYGDGEEEKFMPENAVSIENLSATKKIGNSIQIWTEQGNTYVMHLWGTQEFKEKMWSKYFKEQPRRVIVIYQSFILLADADGGGIRWRIDPPPTKTE